MSGQLALGLGELRLALPVGLHRDDDGGVVLCPDERVRHAIERVFVLWRRLGSARQVLMELIAEGQQLPRRTAGSGGSGGCAPAMARCTLPDQPGLCGRVCVRPHAPRDDDRSGSARAGARRRVPQQQWSVCLPEHHPGYVSWAAYLATRGRLRQNVRPGGEGGGAAREGAALLHGLVRCGRCGRWMQVAYSGNGGKLRRYACAGHVLHHTESACQTLGGGCRGSVTVRPPAKRRRWRRQARRCRARPRPPRSARHGPRRGGRRSSGRSSSRCDRSADTAAGERARPGGGRSRASRPAAACIRQRSSASAARIVRCRARSPRRTSRRAAAGSPAGSANGRPRSKFVRIKRCDRSSSPLACASRLSEIS
jgi:Recombinase zinc beta ribbon domain